MRYRILHELASGGWGTVYKARVPTTGRVVALKVLERRAYQDEVEWELSVELASQGEGNILPRLDHEHIIRCFHSQGWDSPRVEIFMELMDGTLASLAQSLPRGSYRALADHALHQMLQALAYLNRKGYVHRDVKPENIFYKLPSRPPSPGESTESALSRYHFRLGDFGLCAKKSEISILWPHGSVQFMAPELLGGQPQHRQSHKSDVWALYVTILWTLNVKGLRRKMLRRALFGAELAGEAYDEKNGLEDLQKMAEVDPRDRATAGEMLEWLDW